MLLIVDPISTLAADLRMLPPVFARALFLEAVRPLRFLAHTPDGAWEAYRDGRCLPAEARAIERALVERFAPEPEYGRLVSLGLAHTGRPSVTTLVLTAATADEEAGVLEGFWQILGRSQERDLQLVTYGGARWGLAFLLRRSLLLGLAPSASLPLGRQRLEVHFDLDAVLANWDPRRSRPLELAAFQYDLPGPWTTAEEQDGADTAGMIRVALARGDRDAARTVGATRLEALVALHNRLAPSYLGAMA
jgi:hypothetical protein